LQPVGRPRGAGERDRVLALVAALDQVARLELVVDARESRPQPALVVDVDLFRGNLRALERAGNFSHRLGRELRAVAARHLQGRRFAVQVRQGDQDGRDRDGRHQDSLPEGIALHA
jgi:hypothetical protein